VVSSHRLQWHELPTSLRAAIEHQLGGRVVSSVNGRGGYSPSLASRCDLDDGRTVFVKAVSPDQNPDSPRMLRREIEVTRHLPASVPAPPLDTVLDDGHWIVGVFEFVDGRPPATPWERDELDAVIAAMAALPDRTTPELRSFLAPAAEQLASTFGHWRAVAVDPPAGLDQWARAHLDDLIALDDVSFDAVAGDALVHLDVRSDNALLTSPDDKVTLVDWPHACIGAVGLDLVVMLPSVALEGGGDPEQHLARAGSANTLAPAAIDAIVAGMAGFFVDRGRQPDPPGLPTLRAFQRAHAEVTLRWLRSRLGDREQQ
jgi:Ser/Thr protein kinase RdoA (MazF antagonist)